MRISLTIHEKEVRLCRDDGALCRTWTDNNDLLEQFFPALDALLAHDGRAVTDITDVTVHMDVPRGYTTARIARTIVRTLRFGLGLPLVADDEEETT